MFITNEELIETILDPSERMKDRCYSLSTLNYRTEGTSEKITPDDVHHFCITYLENA